MDSSSNRRPWTKPEKSFLIDNYLKGMPIKQLVRNLGRTLYSVDGQIRSLGLSKMRKEIRDNNQISILDYLVNHTINQTAEHFNIPVRFTKGIAESYPGGLKNLRFERKRNAAIEATSRLP